MKLESLHKESSYAKVYDKLCSVLIKSIENINIVKNKKKPRIGAFEVTVGGKTIFSKL